MKTRFIKSILTLFLAFTVLPIAANDYLKIYFKDGHTERHFMKLVENITVTKYDQEGNLHSNYQMQQIVMKDTTYSYYLADIDSMAFRKVYEEQIKKDIETVTSGAESALQSCQTVEEMRQHLEELRSLEGVESVSMIPSGVVIQVRDWRYIFYIIPPEYIEEDEQQYSSENLARLKLFQNRTPMTSSSDSGRPIKVALANKMHGDATRMGQQSAMTTLDLELKLLGFESQYINNVDLKFFLEDIYEYDHVILMTHGIYNMYTGVHHLATDTKIHKSESGNWILDSETEALLDQSDIDELGLYTAQFGGIDFAYYATVSENFINKRTSKMEHQKPSIFFNGACLSLCGNDILERSVEPYKVWGNDNMAKALCKDNSFDIYIGYTDENIRGIHGGVNLFRNMLNGQSEEVAFSNIKPKYLYDDYLHYQAYLTEVCYDSNPQTSPRKSFLVKTKTKEMSALDIVAYDVDGKIRLRGNTTMLYPKESTVKCGFKYTFDGVDYHEILCEKEYNGGDFREDNVSFSTTIDSPSGQYLTYRAFTYDGINYNYGDVCFFKIGEAEPAPEKVVMLSKKVRDTTYDIYKIITDKDNYRTNPDGWKCYKSSLILDITKNSQTTTYTIDDNIYLDAQDSHHGGQRPCMYFHFDGDEMFIFINSKDTQYRYTMNGYAYRTSLSNISFKRETVFSGYNWGWYPYFTHEDGALALKHFSFAGYYAMTSYRNSNGTWSTQGGSYITPDEFDRQSEETGDVFVADDNSSVANLQLSQAQITLVEGNSCTVEITAGSGEYGVTNLGSDHAVATLQGTTITIVAVTAGDAQVVVTDMQSGQKVIIDITVTASGDALAYPSCPDGNHPHMIDLGLPSGTKWACCNVGASTPEQYGNYYAWGETQPKSVYNWDTYQYGSNWDNVVNIGSDIAGTSYDAATAKWGAPWRMPSLTKIKELLNNTTSAWTTQNGVNGRKFTGPNGGTIFLPAAGERLGGELDDAGNWGDYWSSTLYESAPNCAYDLYFDSGDADWGPDWSYCIRTSGHSVRPVR